MLSSKKFKSDEPFLGLAGSLKEKHSKRLEDKLQEHFEIDYVKSKLKRDTFADTLISGEITSGILSCYQEDSDTEELKVIAAK